MRSISPSGAAEVNLRQILDGSLAFIGLLDVDGTLLEANALALTAGGLTRDDVIGKKFWDCYWWSYDEDVRAQLKEAHQRARAGANVRYDVCIRVAGGKLIWIDFQLGPMRDASGRVTHLIPSGLDLTSRKVAEDDLRKSEQKFRGIFDNAFVGVALVGLTGDWLEVNDRLCEIIGYTRDELLAKTFQDITHPDDLAADLGGVASLLSGEAANFKMDKRYIRRDGSVVWASLTVAVQTDTHGKPLHFISIVSDISERVRAQEHQRLLMLELAHRLKNQVAIVQAMSNQTARNTGSLSEFQHTFAQRLEALAMSIDLVIQKDEADVSIRDLVDRQLASFSNRRIVEGPDMTITAEAAEMLGLTLHELATNCTKYGPWSQSTGIVRITWNISEAPHGHVLLSWVEEGGPEVRAPTRKGFGRTIVEVVAAQKLNADITLDYGSRGFQWHLKMPLAVLSGR